VAVHDGREQPLNKSGDSDDSRDPDSPGGKTTTIEGPVIPVNIDLRNYDESPRFVNGVRLYLDATHLVAPVLSSPVFSNAPYSSSERPTQFADAVQRAEFFHQASDDWHTTLEPHAKKSRTIVLIRGTYSFALYADGKVAYVIVDEGAFSGKLFPATPTDTSTPIGAAEHADDIHTKDISTFLFNNVFLSNGPGCCVLGSIRTTQSRVPQKTDGRRNAMYSTIRAGSRLDSLRIRRLPTLSR